jgi:RNA-directed DNA polymerase
MRKVEISVSRLFASNFLAMRSVNDLCTVLKIELNELHTLFANPSYNTFYLKKKSGGLREINSPQDDLSKVQRRLCMFLNSVYLTIAHASVYGFVQEPNLNHPAENAFRETRAFFLNARTIIGNAQKHVNKKLVLNIDLSDFFGSCSASRVRQVFLRAPFNFEMELATCLALLTTYRKKLPAGSPSSPILTNFIALGMDKQLAELSKRNKIVYTRYADDLTFSSNAGITAVAIHQIRNIIDSCGFRINYKKFRMQKHTARQVVTGIKVNRFPNVDRKYIRNLRAILFQWEKKGVRECALRYYSGKQGDENSWILNFSKMVAGRISFVGAVKGENDDIFQKLHQRFQKLQERNL